MGKVINRLIIVTHQGVMEYRKGYGMPARDTVKIAMIINESTEKDRIYCGYSNEGKPLFDVINCPVNIEYEL